jgi:anthranilate/para-aminobenzoate synthase component I
MIVDLTRNDLGRICEFGTVTVERLCELEEHPTLFHLVSTVTGKVRKRLPYSEIVRALFPCGSITGAPKLSTMKIISELERAPRGLSMGSIGLHIPQGFAGIEPSLEMNVAIRTIVVTGSEAVFNVGGGVVIDSDPASEYDESLLKAQALLAAVGSELSGN